MGRFDLMGRIRGIFLRGRALSSSLWGRFKRLRRWQKALVIVVILLALWGLAALLGAKETPVADTNQKTVSLATVAALSGAEAGADIVGAVRAVSEAEIVTETGGTVRAIHTSLGSSVAAGYVIAEFDNASERGALLSAEGAYEAALAARDATSLANEETSAENVYRSAFTDLETTLETEIDLFFGVYTTYGPNFAIAGSGSAGEKLSRERVRLRDLMNVWRKNLETTTSRKPDTLLTEAETVAHAISDMLILIAREANRSGSNATAAQLAALESARATSDATLASLASARKSFQAGSVGATASADASVKQALGALRLAQANFEKTLVRAPISGVVNFLPLRAGSYVFPQTHVATVANNGVLEIVANVSEETRALIQVGDTFLVEDRYTASVASLSPALNPETKQVEVRLTVLGETDLTNGTSVRIALPADATREEGGPVALPLTSVKLLPENRVIFTVDEEHRLVAMPVETGMVRGSRIEILSPLDTSLRIVVDARGRSEGERVRVVGEERAQ